MERPILFKGEMVRAILEGRKTQTRRVIKPQPQSGCKYGLCDVTGSAFFSDSPDFESINESYPLEGTLKCPYGSPGDELWVREMWRVYRGTNSAQIYFKASEPHSGIQINTADFDYLRSAKPNWRPSIHMPRWASRIQLAIEGVEAQRIQEIWENSTDVLAEGCPIEHVDSYRHGWFKDLWNSINAIPKPCKSKGIITHYESYPWGIEGSGERGLINGVPHYCYPNPWVWAVKFRRVKP